MGLDPTPAVPDSAPGQGLDRGQENNDVVFPVFILASKTFSVLFFFTTHFLSYSLAFHQFLHSIFRYPSLEPQR